MTEFNFLHKKQSGGSGQFARVIGYIEPIEEEETEEEEEIKPEEVDPNDINAMAKLKNEMRKKKRQSKGGIGSITFENHIIGNTIPPEFIAAIEKGIQEGAEKGPLVAAPIVNVRFVVTDGAAHAVDSNEMAFRTAAKGALREAIQKSSPYILEPIMKVQVTAPDDCQGAVVGSLNRRRGNILECHSNEGYSVIDAEVPLNEMFGYSTDLRATTQAKGEFTMEFVRHSRMGRMDQEKAIKEYQELLKSRQK